MRAACAAALAALVLLAGGCAGHRESRTLPPLAIQLSDGPTAESFARLAGIAHRHGYAIEFADPAYGVFGVSARTQLPRAAGRATFVVQCYADGRAVLSVLGPQPAGHGLVVASSNLRREAVALAQALERE